MKKIGKSNRYISDLQENFPKHQSTMSSSGVETYTMNYVVHKGCRSPNFSIEREDVVLNSFTNRKLRYSGEITNCLKHKKQALGIENLLLHEKILPVNSCWGVKCHIPQWYSHHRVAHTPVNNHCSHKQPSLNSVGHTQIM